MLYYAYLLRFSTLFERLEITTHYDFYLKIEMVNRHNVLLCRLYARYTLHIGYTYIIYFSKIIYN